MLSNIFGGLFSSSSLDISIGQFVVCVVVALALGVLNAFLLSVSEDHHSKGFLTTLAIIPAVVCMIIIMVNGNIGTGVAVAGAFSLVRFRSVPGTAKEIGGIFIAMAGGISLGMGYIGFAVFFTVLVTLFLFALSKVKFGDKQDPNRMLRVTIPEHLNYSDAFFDLFDAYTSKHSLISVKTSNMGSMFKLTYSIVMKNSDEEKAFIDDLRCRNGNLEISISQSVTLQNEL